jgi:hypothetical protein
MMRYLRFAALLPSIAAGVFSGEVPEHAICLMTA